ncbi:MAG: leucine-rich repeat domain-containing protein [Clostridia bacterium]|nr:leucine-rich repeat domain-containing protein [Clostridia bacterium]
MINNDFEYTIHDSREVWIKRYNGCDKTVTIPASIEGLPVRTICQHAFFSADTIEIRVEEGIETIESEGFALCEELIRVVLPSSLKKLGQGVFNASTSIEQIVFPNGNPVFYVKDGALYNEPEQALVLLLPGLKTKRFTVPTGIKVIASGAFYQNASLEYVRLPLTLEKIERGSFLFASNMRIIELPPYIKEIEQQSFLLGQGAHAEKPFAIYAFPNTVGYRYAVENHIPVHPLYAIVTD